jgi:AraC family transcriptional regulator
MKNDVIVFGCFQLYIAERLLKRNGSPVGLKGRAFDILIALVERAGEIVDEMDLMALVWPDGPVDENSLRFHVAALCNAFGDKEDSAKYVITLPGRGYCFVSPVSRSMQPGPETGLTIARLDTPSAPQTRMVGTADDVQRLSGQIEAERFQIDAGAGDVEKTTTAGRVSGRQICGGVNASVVFAQTAASRVDLMEKLSIRSISSDEFSIMHIARKGAGHGMTDHTAKRDCFVACVHLEKLDAYDVWCNDEHEPSTALEAGVLHINDMRCAWRADIRSPFHVVNFCIPQSAFDEITSEEGGAPIAELNCPISIAHADTVLKNFALALLPALANSNQANELFADHAARAVTAHLAKTYAPIQFRPRSWRGGLAPWQERRAKEMLRANLSGDLSLQLLANACRLSAGHFSRAFKETVGCPPHQWLLHQRIERAKQLMLNTDGPLCEIALDTGFVDQSHFTRVFSQRVKASPAAWRREHGR